MYNGLTLPTAADDDLDDFFSVVNSSGASNLAGIFGVALQPPPDETNTTLKYVPPKPSHVQPEKSNWNVVIARVVTAFKLGASKQYECQGRLGFALLQLTSDSAAAKLILYRTKEQILSTVVLEPNKTLTFKQQYLQYTDDSNIFWSLNFATSDEANVFLQELDKKCTVTRVNANEPTEDAIKIETDLSEAAADTDTDTDTVPNDTTFGSDIIWPVASVSQALPLLTATKPSNRYKANSPFLANGGGDASLVLSSIPSHSHSQHAKPTNISVAVQPAPLWQSNYSPSNLHNFISENRIQNAEARMNITKLETKLDRVLDNIEMLKLSGGRSTMQNGGIDSDDEIIKLEEKIVELKKENRFLKLKLANAEHSMPVATTTHNNEEIISLKQELEAANKNLEKLHQECADNKTKIEKLEDQLSRETDKANSSVLETDELASKIQVLEGTLSMQLEKNQSTAEQAQVHDKLNAKIEQLEKQLKAKETEIVAREKSGQAAQAKSHETIRAIMNKLYVELFQNVNGRDTLTSAEVLKLTAELIRRETKAALNQTE